MTQTSSSSSSETHADFTDGLNTAKGPREQTQRKLFSVPGLSGLSDLCGWIGDNGRVDAFLDAAIEEAARGLAEGGIPIGAVLVHRGTVLGRGHNRRVQQGSAVLHGEMDALERAGRQPASVYRESVMYTTLSPCAMCSGAILLYGIPHVVVGENRTFMGEEELMRARGVRVDVVQDERCTAMMKAFIAAHPELWNEDIGKQIG